MESWILLAERFGLPVVLLGGVSYALWRMFIWMSQTLLIQLNENAIRSEKINIKLINVINDLKMEIKNLEAEIREFKGNQDTFITFMEKITGNGFSRIINDK